MSQVGSRFSRGSLDFHSFDPACKFVWLLTCLFVFSILGIVEPACAVPPLTRNVTVPGVRLRQSSSMYGDRLSFTFCPKGFKLANLETGITTSACAPDWTVHIVNPETKKYFDVPLNRYEGFMLRASVIFWGFSFPQVPFDEVTGGSESVLDRRQILGSKCRVFQMKKLDKFERAKLGISSVHRATLKTLDTSALPYSPETLQFVRRHFNFPKLGDLPVYMRIQHKAKKMLFMLDTSKIEKVQVELETFKVPQGMTRALNDKDVLRGKAENSGVDSLLKEIDRKAI